MATECSEGTAMTSVPTSESTTDVTPTRHPLDELNDTISLYGDPVIVALGLLGNMCSFIVMRRPAMRTSSSSVYFSALAVFDSLFLVRQLFISSTLAKKYFDFLRASNIVCKAGEFFAPFSLDMAAWTVLAVTAERMVVVTWPLRAKAWCTHRTAHVVIGVMVAVFGLLWAAILVVYRGPGIGKCDNDEYVDFLLDHGYILSLTLHTLIPTPALVITNIILAARLSRIQATRAKLTDNKPNGTAPNIAKATTTTLLVSVTYIIFTLPVAGFSFINTFYDVTRTPLTGFVGMQCLRLRYINHGINFALYLLGLPKVRSEMKVILKCGKGQTFSSETRFTTIQDGSTSAIELNSRARPSVSSSNF